MRLYTHIWRWGTLIPGLPACIYKISPNYSITIVRCIFYYSTEYNRLEADRKCTWVNREWHIELDINMNLPALKCAYKKIILDVWLWLLVIASWWYLFRLVVLSALFVPHCIKVNIPISIFLFGGLDYKLLMTGEDPLSILMPVLSSTNVHVIAKLANKVPCKVAVSLKTVLLWNTYFSHIYRVCVY